MDLGLKDNQYGAAVSIVYATYVVFEPICKFQSQSPHYPSTFLFTENQEPHADDKLAI